MEDKEKRRDPSMPEVELPNPKELEKINEKVFTQKVALV
jgi:hypothetical protein